MLLPCVLDPQGAVRPRGPKVGLGGAHSRALLAVLLQRFLHRVLHKVRTGDFLRDRHGDREGAEELHSHLGEAIWNAGVGAFTWKEKR